jgi:virginiamycin B lyase
MTSRSNRIAAVGVALALATLGCSHESKPNGSPGATSSATAVTLKGPFASAAQIRPTSWVETGQTDAAVFVGSGLLLSATLDEVVAIDLRTERVRWRVDVPAYRVAAGFGSVWATDLEGNLVRRLDARSGRVQREIPVPDGPIGVLVAAGHVWVGAHRGGSVSRIDPRTDKVVSTTRVGPAGPRGPFDLAPAGQDVYIGVNNANALVRLNARSAKVTGRVRFPDDLLACGPLTVDGPVVWVTGCMDNDRVARVDVRAGRVVGSDGLRTYLGGGVVRGRAVWFAGASIAPERGEEWGGSGLVALDRATGSTLVRLRSDGVGASAVVAAGSWWVVQRDGVAKFRLEDLVVE